MCYANYIILIKILYNYDYKKISITFDEIVIWRFIMNIVIAIDSFKGSLSSMEAGEAIGEGIKRVSPEEPITICPLADGGEGTVEALAHGMKGTLFSIHVTGPLGKPVTCTYGIIEHTKTAIIEMSGAAGITLVSETEKNPLYTTTYGVGKVIKDAITRGCRRFIIGIGGSATNDGGAGMQPVWN
jgi:glycerate kinase